MGYQDRYGMKQLIVLALIISFGIHSSDRGGYNSVLIPRTDQSGLHSVYTSNVELLVRGPTPCEISNAFAGNPF